MRDYGLRSVCLQSCGEGATVVVTTGLLSVESTLFVAKFLATISSYLFIQSLAAVK